MVGARHFFQNIFVGWTFPRMPATRGRAVNKMDKAPALTEVIVI